MAHRRIFKRGGGGEVGVRVRGLQIYSLHFSSQPITEDLHQKQAVLVKFSGFTN